MKKLLILSVLLITTGFILTQEDKIIAFLDKVEALYGEKEVLPPSKNIYYRNYDFDFVQNTDNFKPYCKQDIYNIFYTVINSGESNFVFYCPDDYTNCLSDIKELANDQSTLSDINNFVHPYNSFSHIETEYDSAGQVSINVHRSYNSDTIADVEKSIDYILNDVLDSNKTDIENIRLAHDYIINNSIYDTNRSDNNIIKYKSDIAYGPLIQGYGICGGYTDAMEIILERLGVKSYRVSSNNHIWNAVYLEDSWRHLDLTWDDPVVDDGSQVLEHNFFLISTKELLDKDSSEHDFNQDVYYELKIN